MESGPQPNGPLASHTFTGLSDCPRVFLSIAAKLIDMSFLDEKENIRARISGGAGTPAVLSDCGYNGFAEGNTCGRRGYVMCGNDVSALVGEPGELTVEVLGSTFIRDPCEDGIALSSILTVECGSSSDMGKPIEILS